MTDQAAVTGGQIAAGAANMVFSVLMARLLSPGGFAQLASFLALYLLCASPGSAVSAGACLDPERASRLRRRGLAAGVALGAGIGVGSPWISPLLRLPAATVVALGLAVPALGLLSLERGRLYARRSHARLVESFLAEPVARFAFAVGLAAVAGPSGGALGVVLAGYAALAVARWRQVPPGETSHATVPGGPRRADAGPAALTFLAIAAVQNLDLLLANRVLPPGEAGRFAVVSTIGGVAAFATVTVPLVLLPRRADGQRDGLAAALWTACGVGLAAVSLAAVGGPVVGALFGARYSGARSIVLPYMAAMALLGVARVLLAHRCGTGSGRSAAGMVGGAGALQVGLILGTARDARGVALSTLVAVSALTGAAVVAHGARQGWGARAAGLVRRAARTSAVLPACACVAGLGVRMVVPRGLWLDEVTSVHQARMPFTSMLQNLRATDVHPPLYFSVLWVAVRALGSGEVAVRVPSVVAGALVIPFLYLLGREAYDRRTGLVAAAAGTFAPIMVWYSQEARMYALMMLFGVVAMWAQVRLLRRGGRAMWLVYALASSGLVWTQYFGLFQVVVQQCAFAAVLRRRRRDGLPTASLVRGWLSTALLIGLLCAPLVPFAREQFVVNQTAGRGFGGPQQVGAATSPATHHLGVYAALANVIWAVWGYHSDATMALLAALWPLGMLFVLAMLGRRRRPVTSLLVAAVAVPGCALFLLGTFKRDLFDVRYLSTAVPVLFVLIARVVAAMGRRRSTVIGAAALLTATMAVGLLDQQLNGTNPRLYAFRGALGRVDALARPGDVLLYEPADLRLVVGYYSPHLEARPLTGGPAMPPGHTVFVVASRSLMKGPRDSATLFRALAALRSSRPQVLDQSFPNVELWEFR